MATSDLPARRGLAAWSAAERERLGFGTIVVLHQLGHPEKRNKSAEYDEHERYNAKVDALTHAIMPVMPIYVPFRRAGRRQTQLWYEPLQQENVGHGTCDEVTSDQVMPTDTPHVRHSGGRLFVGSWNTAVSSTQRTSAEQLAVHHRRGARLTSLNCTIIIWRLKLEWRCGVA